MTGPTESPAEPVVLEPGQDLEDAIPDDGVTLVDFTAAWCGPCQQMEPILEAIAASGEATVVTVDVDRHQDLATDFSVRGVPTLVLYEDGERADRHVGFQSEARLRELIEAA